MMCTSFDDKPIQAHLVAPEVHMNCTRTGLEMKDGRKYRCLSYFSIAVIKKKHDCDGSSHCQPDYICN